MPTAALASAPSCRPEPDRALVYRLQLTAPATFCASSAAPPGDPACATFPKKSALQLHGLWPSYQHGFGPQGRCDDLTCPTPLPGQGFCAFPAPAGLYASPTWRALKDLMAGTEKCLERHEWVVHGTCSGLPADRYFDLALTATQGLVDRLALPVDTPISRVQFNQWSRQRLPDYDGALHLTCDGPSLLSLRVMLAWTPAGPGAALPDKGGNLFGNCGESFTLPSSPP
ncbi:ribonuclease T2 family protein [Roseateles chitinivorans]|uniref:ribonuclease T2 family protein n=1 Tax=Roseateles chitinivorans TaxID=2917965 RepID=UPI003D66EC43